MVLAGRDDVVLSHVGANSVRLGHTEDYGKEIETGLHVAKCIQSFRIFTGPSGIFRRAPPGIFSKG